MRKERMLANILLGIVMTLVAVAFLTIVLGTINGLMTHVANELHKVTNPESSHKALWVLNK